VLSLTAGSMPLKMQAINVPFEEHIEGNSQTVGGGSRIVNILVRSLHHSLHVDGSLGPARVGVGAGGIGCGIEGCGDTGCAKRHSNQRMHLALSNLLLQETRYDDAHLAQQHDLGGY